ncbi:hypothetical protein [Terricaulis silvestris]|uniref:Uncharacterized protein n=1 Tax=Terricaulis silvestris TaxID=2686094 RepID=A0A6I6MU98_9CAUL|nr:hypothetical protein [Terricaulis silvestris]QGZ94743.1 hypothetical protein DSM104635_01573 [Terricaulis silvestris]
MTGSDLMTIGFVALLTMAVAVASYVVMSVAQKLLRAPSWRWLPLIISLLVTTIVFWGPWGLLNPKMILVTGVGHLLAFASRAMLTKRASS